LMWGVEDNVRERLGKRAGDLSFTRHMMIFDFPFGPVEVVEHFRQFYGPTNKAFAALDESGQAALRRDLEQLWTDHNKASGAATRVESEYLEVIATRV